MSPAITAAPAADGSDQPSDRNPRPEAVLSDVQVAQWLHAHPDFFDLHADLLAEVRLRHPNRGRAISLVERQVLVLRERSRALEASMADLIRIGQENEAIGMRLEELTQELLRTRDQARLPELLLQGLRLGFGVPQVAVRLWGIEDVAAPFGDAVSAELRGRVDELQQPYCGPNSFPEAAAWLRAAGDETASMAMLPLRSGRAPGHPLTASESVPVEPVMQQPSIQQLATRQLDTQQPAEARGPAFGLLVLGSPDPARFQAGMGTAFLGRIAELAGASLSRLLPR